MIIFIFDLGVEFDSNELENLSLSSMMRSERNKPLDMCPILKEELQMRVFDVVMHSNKQTSP